MVLREQIENTISSPLFGSSEIRGASHDSVLVAIVAGVASANTSGFRK